MSGENAVVDASPSAGEGSGGASGALVAASRVPGPFGGLSASEAARRAAASREANRREREAAATLDRLSVIARAGVAAAAVLTYAEQVAILSAMAEKAKGGNVQAAAFCRDWLIRLGASTGDDGPTDGVDPADMTPAQRASARAELLRMLQGGDSPA